ncbi:MAG: hypothetical protein GY854_31305 [Deltaproteobacteria bacterium]|nr:hypothetical protein [Deltaproteobacteria bacterium]
MPQDQTITLRIAKAEEITERADKLLPIIAALPEYRALRVSRSVVLRLALLKGLEELEAEHKPKKKRRR